MVRVSAEKREATRRRILEVAQKHFTKRGFEETTIRGIAADAGIAAGTCFNYFSSKEAIVVQLVSDALHATGTSFTKRRRDGAALEEDLFLYVSTGLRQMRAVRRTMSAVLESHLTPLNGGDATADAIRTEHLETVTSLLTEHGFESPSAVDLQMYWLLYTGVIAFWTRDESTSQEETLALLDQSINMFSGWIRRESEPSD